MVQIIEVTGYIKSIVVTLLLLTLVPIIVALLLPFFVWRFIVKILHKLFFPKNGGKMLNSLANIFAIEYPQLFKSKSHGFIYVTQITRGHIPLHEIYEYCLQITQIKIGATNKFKYPELRQTITCWMGYLFWEWDPNFRIENHVTLYSQPSGSGDFEIRSEKDLTIIYNQLAEKPFANGRSPWGVLVCHLPPNEGGIQKTAIILRCHHSLCDGFSIMKGFLGEEAVNKMKEKFEKSNEQNSIKKSLPKLIWKMVTLPWRIPFDLVRSKIKADDHDWGQGPWSGDLRLAKSPLIAIDFIKQIKNLHKTSFHTIIQAAMAGGIRNFMKRNNIKIPAQFSCALSLPMRGHPSNLRNHMTSVITSLPIGLEDPRARIRAIDSNLRALRKSTVPFTNFYAFKMAGSLPHCVGKLLGGAKAPTCILTNFPGPLEQVFMLGRQIESVQFGGSLMRRMGFGVGCLSYNGNIQLGVTVDKVILPDEKLVGQLLQNIIDELHVLCALEMA